MGRLKDPPGPIDNKAIITTTVSRSLSGAPLNLQILKNSSDYVQVAHLSVAECNSIKLYNLTNAVNYRNISCIICDAGYDFTHDYFFKHLSRHLSFLS